MSCLLKNRYFNTICFLIISLPLFSQDFSNKGKDFWVAYSGHIDGTTSRMALYITSDQNASGTVNINGNQIPFTVTANQVRTVQLTNTSSPSNAVAYNAQIEGIGAKKGIHITSDRPVVVYSHILNAARSGSTLVLPTNVLGKEYYVTSYKSVSTGSGRRSQFNVVATLDNTTIEITPTQADASGVHPANVPFQVSLSKGDVYQYQSDEDLTGTFIKSIGTSTASCQPVAVFSGSTFTSMGCSNAGSGDNLYQQLFPFGSWGKLYYTAPFRGRSFDIFRILVQDPNEPVYVNGVALNAGSLIKGRYYEINTQGNNSPRIITSNKPISVVQYMITMSCDGSNTSDPEMVVLNAVEQTLNDITVMSARRDLTPPNTNITSHYLNIIFKSNTFASLKIDGAAPVAAPTTIAGTNYSYIQEDVTGSTNFNPAHRITSDSGFICIAYGYGNVESYGYNAGTNVKDLYQYITLQNQYATTNFPATCKNTPFNYAITLPYKATSLTWDFNNNPNLSPNTPIVNNAPVPDSSIVVEGKTLYVYNLPGKYSFSATGTYPVKVVANNPTPDGCSGTQEINYDVEVFDPPKPEFFFTSSGCASDTVRFADSSSGNQRPIIKWNWDFGDNTTSNVKNPGKRFDTSGIFKVALQIITDVGCIADTFKTVAVSPKPIAHYTLTTPACVNKTMEFADSSTITSGSITSWMWNFGDGTPAVITTTAAPVSHTFALVGKYTVTLQVTSETGCRSEIFSREVTIHPNPVANFSFGNICLPEGKANFINLTTISDGTTNGLTYSWQLGDNNTSTAKDPVHYYPTVGPYNVKLAATSAPGCSHDTTLAVATIFPQATSDFVTSNEVCLGDTSRFVDNSNGNGSTIIQWHWQFGDGAADTSKNPVHVYKAAGTYAIKLFSITDKGCNSDTATKSIIVNPLPTANFSFAAPACETKQIVFTDASVPNAGSLISRTWQFGDSTSATYNNLEPVNKIYNSWGTYNVRLSLETNKGCKAEILKPVNIHPQPVVQFLLPEVCLNDAFAQFTDSSYIADNTTGFAYSWNFGDANANAANPNTSTQKNPRHKYQAVGIYNVTLQVTSQHGCITSITKPFTVNGSIPIAAFSVLKENGLCSNETVQIQNNSTVDFGSITRIEIIWDAASTPGVIVTDDMPAPNKLYVHKYPSLQQTKSYQIIFRAYSGSSCVNQTSRTVTIQASPKVVFNTIPGICLDASPRQITQAIETASLPGTFIYSGIGVTPSGTFNPAISKAGDFQLQYTYISSAGCRDSATQSITVWPSPVANFSTSSPVCETRDVTFTDLSVADFGKITQWSWNFGDSTSDIRNSGQQFLKKYSKAGSYLITLLATTDSGCKSIPAQKLLVVNPLPAVDFSLPVVCLPAGAAQFNSSSTIADNTESQFTYAWQFGVPGDTAGATAKNPLYHYSATGPYQVKLTVTSGAGCANQITKQLTTIYQPPVATFAINPLEVCLGANFTLTDNSSGVSGAVTQWLWNFGDGTTSSLQNPVHKYTSSNTFQIGLTVTNDKGCISQQTVNTAVVHPYPTINAGPDLVVLEGGAAKINPVATGNDLSYLWSPVTYLDSSRIKSPTVRPLNDITYTIEVTGRGGCKLSDDVFVKVLKSPVIPNAFSPNGDGINDTWNIAYIETYPGATVEVFNRYGQIIFSSAGYARAWDGTMKGQPVPAGVYYYVINPKNGRKQLAGSLTIIR